MDDDPTVPGTVCVAADVVVDGKQAVWIFTEFETDEPLTSLRDWIKPENWPKWGAAMFKQMSPVGPVTEVPTPAGQLQTSANYLEVVELGGQELQTVLACEITSAPKWAGMSYDLVQSVGNMLQVDRGYLVAIDAGNRRLVKALKVVGFTDTRLNVAATTVCPGWSTWVRQATTLAAAESSSGYTAPTPGSVGDTDPNRSDFGGAAATAFTQGYGRAWADAVGEQAQFYGEYASDVGNRMWSGDYGRRDLVLDSSRLFMRLARDWSRLWQAGLDASDQWAEADVPPTAGPGQGGGGNLTIEHTAVLVPPVAHQAAVSVTDLSRVGRSQAVLRSTKFAVRPPTVGPSDQSQFVTIETDTTGVPAGLYEGEVLLGSSPDGGAPAIFYVSRARPAE